LIVRLEHAQLYIKKLTTTPNSLRGKDNLKKMKLKNPPGSLETLKSTQNEDELLLDLFFLQQNSKQRR
jgi:hypothetical protein